MPTQTSVNLSEGERRTLGAYYTPGEAASLMAQWVVAHQPATILEPSFGDGVFLRAIEDAVRRKRRKPHLVGAELLSAAFDAAHASLSLTIDGHAGDFLSLPTRPVDAAIGNPPFVRLRHLPIEQRDNALRAANVALGFPMDPSGSTWMPFVLHAAEFLNDGGCLALVLPHELTYVKYARPLWSYLASKFTRLRVIRTYDRMFGDLLQDVVILLGEGKGGTCTEVAYQVSRTLTSLEDDSDLRMLNIEEIVAGKRHFHHALLSPQILKLLDNTLIPATVAIGDAARVRIGYVAGDKQFFHPGTDVIKTHRLPARSLRTSFGAGRLIRGKGLFSSTLPKSSTQQLWLPDKNKLTKGELAYINIGEDSGVSGGYKCSIRSPWYVIPGVEAPDVIFSVFSDRPLAILNDADLVASNSLLCASMLDGYSSEWLVGSWYSSITQLFIELEVHSLGGGVLVAVPQELSRVRVPVKAPSSTDHLRRLHTALAADDYLGACGLGDEFLLENGTITQRELKLVKGAISTLQRWRHRPTN